MPYSEAVLAMWADITPNAEAEFNEWHSREHIPERVNVPGFLGGRRYRAIAGRPRYFMSYEIEGLATATSSPYLARLNDPTEWTRRMTPHFRNFMRTAFRITARLGGGHGGVAAVLRFAPKAGRDDALRRWLTDTALPATTDRPGIVGTQLWEADVRASKVDTAERALRGVSDRLANWVVLIEGIDDAAVRAARRGVLSRQTLHANGAGGSRAGLYRLQHSVVR